MGISISGGDIDDIGDGNILIDMSMYSAVIQGTWTWTTFAETAYSFPNFKNVTSHANADEVNYKAYLSKGTYVPFIVQTKGTQYGIIKIYVDGTLVLTADGYNGSTLYAQRTEGAAFAITSKGVKTIRVVVDGKHASSTDYRAYISKLGFIRSS